jgi:hypothetical protein
VKKESSSSMQESLQGDTAVCPTCGQSLGRDAPDGVVLVPDLTGSSDEPVPPGSARAEAPTDADVEWALSPPLTAEKREFLRVATQSVAVEQDRFETRAAQLAAFEAMWPPRKPKGRRKKP